MGFQHEVLSDGEFIDLISNQWGMICSYVKEHSTLGTDDIKLIENMLYKSSDDTAVAVARSFERLEDKIDASESRLYSLIREIETKIVSAQ